MADLVKSRSDREVVLNGQVLLQRAKATTTWFTPIAVEWAAFTGRKPEQCLLYSEPWLMNAILKARDITIRAFEEEGERIVEVTDGRTGRRTVLWGEEG